MPELLALFFLYQEVDQTRRKWWIRALLWMIPLLLLVVLADVYIHPWAGLLLVTTVLFIVHFWQKPSESGSSLWSKLRSKTPDSAS
ncbi:hypothetical protein EON79_19725 [bacterium]|nr:MAG: hypothetical protein EON79_19725 [bacterium]